jgi:hypothetical protein
VKASELWAFYNRPLCCSFGSASACRHSTNVCIDVDGAAQALGREALEIAQLESQSAAAAALQQMGGRFASGTEPLAILVREHLDLSILWRSCDDALTAALSKPEDQQSPSTIGSRHKYLNAREPIRPVPVSKAGSSTLGHAGRSDPLDQPHGITTHQSGHRTLVGVRVAFSTISCSLGVSLSAMGCRRLVLREASCADAGSKNWLVNNMPTTLSPRIAFCSTDWHRTPAPCAHLITRYETAGQSVMV